MTVQIAASTTKPTSPVVMEDMKTVYLVKNPSVKGIPAMERKKIEETVAKYGFLFMSPVKSTSSKPWSFADTDWLNIKKRPQLIMEYPVR